MKRKGRIINLKLTIPQRPGFLHFMPVLDILVVVFAFPLLAFQFSSSGGHKVLLPSSSTRIPNIEHAIVIEVLPGDPLQIWINQQKIKYQDLDSRLDKAASEWFYGGDPVAILKFDRELKNHHVATVRDKLASRKYAVWIAEQLKENVK